MNKERKWIGFKDIVLIALLTALSIVIQIISAVPFMASPQLIMFAAVAILMILCGPIYMLMMSKAPRQGAALLYGGIQALYYCLIGQFMIGVVFLLGAVISECVLLNSGYRKPLRIVVAYLVYAAVYPIATYLPYLILADQYTAQLSAAGLPKASIDSMMGIYASPVMISLAALSSCIFAALGGFIGYKLLKKHFKPAGVV